MSRQDAIDSAAHHFDSGTFREELTRLVAVPTESHDPLQEPELRRYLTEEVAPRLDRMGFAVDIAENPVSARHPFLVARRTEAEGLPTLLTYGHADVQPGHPDRWRTGLDPWRLTVEGERWYGRGVADNKGQHLVNLVALEHVIGQRQGTLGYNVVVLLETGEEFGSPGLAEFCEQERGRLLAADLLIGSDGPRVATDRPTVFLGSRGAVNFTLGLELREGSHHSGNLGGLLRNPGTVLANAIACLVDDRGSIRVEGLRPAGIPDEVRRALADIPAGTDGPAPDPGWGEPGLTPNERLFAWNTIEVLAMTTGQPDNPTNAIPGTARAHCQLRFVVGLEASDVEGALRKHLDEHGFDMVEVTADYGMEATRLDPDNPWVRWTLDSLERTTGTTPALLPNLAGSLPNSAFSRGLGLPTVWVPHSYPGCSQHAPDEHLPAPLVRESLQVMAGLFWDLAELSGLGTWPPQVPSSDDDGTTP
ncbi:MULTISPECIES: M20 family metallopeptidase [unclassified Streptomyces]|uniref:M20 family metallopeptidase n=1 Tax=unclassified Streptomyces TaxID=2593676 RepID=UPI002E187F5A|nr:MULTISPECIES: M20 family metallopeptidase [unclassified Streptomyces]